MNASDDLEQTFAVEALDLIETLEIALLALDEDPGNPDRVDSAFRALHTLKGSGSMSGFVEVERFAHQVESLFEEVRSGARKLESETLAELSRVLDHLLDLVRCGPQATPNLTATSNHLLRSLHLLEGPGETAGAAPTANAHAGSGRTTDSSAWLVTIAPEADSLRDGLDPRRALDQLRALGPHILVAEVYDVPLLETLEVGNVHVRWSALILASREGQALDEILLELQDQALIRMERLVETVAPERFDPGSPALRAALRTQDARRLVELLGGESKPPKTPAAPARADQPSEPVPLPVLKVPINKLDALVDQVSEMQVLQAQLADRVRGRPEAELIAVTEALQRVSGRVHALTLGLQMLPIGSTLTRFRRLVRDLAHQLEKRVRLELEGADIEVDKAILDALSDPLVHLVRNALDHGLETPAERTRHGKPEEGVLALSVSYVGTRLVVEVRDDGRGLNDEQIRASAVRRGLLEAQARVDPEALHALIFKPGLSTASSVSSLSGRGVGMDAVQNAVHDLGGELHLTSQRGRGTSLRIEVPVRLAMLDGLVVRSGEKAYLLPIDAVSEWLPGPEDGTAETIDLRGKPIPCVWLGVPVPRGGPSRPSQAVVLQGASGPRALLVETVEGTERILIRAPEHPTSEGEGFCGSTLLASGERAWMLDPARIADTGASGHPADG